MYEMEASYDVAASGAAFLTNNLTVYLPEPKADTVVAFIGRKSVQVLSWNDKLEMLRHDFYAQKRTDAPKFAAAAIIIKNDDTQSATSATAKETMDSPLKKLSVSDFIVAADLVADETNAHSSDTAADATAVTAKSFPITHATITTNGVLMQVTVCKPIYRGEPILVVLTTMDVLLVDVKSRATLFMAPTSKIKFLASEASGGVRRNALNTCGYARGIHCIENLISVGCNTGEILQVNCANENNFQVKKLLKEHNASVTDIACCLFDLITVSVDVSGTIVVWSRQMKSASKKISTCQPISVVNVLRKQVLCGTHNGQMLLYSVYTGELMAEVNAHSRQITSISVAPESAYILSASEDSNVRMWKLHTRKPEAFRIEYRYCEKYENASLVGGAFSGTRGSAFVVCSYENARILFFKISRKSTTVKSGQAEAATPTGNTQEAAAKAKENAEAAESADVADKKEQENA